MGLISTTSHVIHTGDGATSAWAYTFKIQANTHLRVVKRLISTGAETPLTLTTDYTVSGVGTQGGGYVTLVAGALAATYQLLIERVPPRTQGTDIANQGDYYPETHETFFDKVVMLVQWLYRLISRAPLLAETSSAGPLTFPDPTEDTESVIVYEDDGTLGKRSLSALAAGAVYNGVEDLAAGATSKEVTLPESIAGGNYAVSAILQNLVDESPMHQPVTLTAISATAFTVEWDSAVDSENYKLRWGVVKGLS